MALVDPNEAPYRSTCASSAIETLCTNRDLPLHMPVGKAHDRLHARSRRAGRVGRAASPARRRRARRAPTPTRAGASSATCRSTICRWSTPTRARAEAAPARVAVALRDLDDVDHAQADRGRAARSRRAGSCARCPCPGRRRSAAAWRSRSPATRRRSRAAASSCWARCWSDSSPSTSRSIRFTETVLRHGQRGEVMRWPTGHRRSGARALPELPPRAGTRRQARWRRRASRSCRAPPRRRRRTAALGAASLSRELLSAMRRLSSARRPRPAALRRCAAARRTMPARLGQDRRWSFAPSSLALRAPARWPRQERRPPLPVISSACSDRTGRCRCTSPSTRASGSATPTTDDCRASSTSSTTG